jgi:Mce-associated membrane protein
MWDLDTNIVEKSPEKEEVEPEAAAAEPVVEPAPASGPMSRPPRPRPWLVAAAAIVIAGLAAGWAITAWKLHDRSRLDAARSSALSAAQSYAIDMASYDYRHLDQDFGKVEQHSTASFQHDFAQSSASLKQVLVQYQATATAKVTGAGVSTASSSKATVVVFVDQTVTNSKAAGKSTTERSRMQLSLVHANGRWLLDKVQLV